MKPANINAASASGTQPPLAIFVALPRMKAMSRTKNTPNTIAMRVVDQPHTVRAKTAPSTVVMNIVPITAAP